MPGLGDEFRAAREARHLTLSDVSDQIHIRSVYLQNIEDGDPTFAAPVYVRGFIRTYARFLGLDPESAVAHFSVASGDGSRPAYEPVSVSPGRAARSGPSPWLWIAAGVAVALVVFVGYKYLDFQRSGGAAPVAIARIASPSPAAASSADPLVGPTPSTRVTPPPHQMLEIRVTADSWMSVKIDGASALEGIVKAGTTKNFHGKSADVRAGNAGGVSLIVNGKALGKMGNAGDVVERTITLAEQ